uniref:Uncharacterized protein n=1 Tax=Tetradesmus obliquus TaxID=3088 RepID=A0A383WKT9_TETOB|eukprot:jgi/Sobl393_1/10551/SZX77779.1
MSSSPTADEDVGSKGTDSPQSSKASGKPAGTGFFLPLAMRSSESTPKNERVNSRAKPSRQRNVSTPNIGLGSSAVDRTVASLRSNSSSNLRNGRRHTPDGHPRRFSLSIEEDCAAHYGRMPDMQAGPGNASQLAAFPASAYSSHAAAVAAALAATSAGQACSATSMPQQQQQQQLNLAAFSQLPPGLEQPLQQHRASPRAHDMQRQHTPPVQLPALDSSSSASPRVSSSSGGGLLEAGSSSMAALPARLAAQAEPVPGSSRISADALQTFYGTNVNVSALQQPLSGPVDVLPSVDSSSDLGPLLVMHSSSSPALSELPGPAAPSPSPATPGGGGSGGLGHATAASPAAAAAAAGADGTRPIFSQLSLNTWAVPPVPQADATPAREPDAGSPNMDDSEEIIQKRIDELLLQKQLLQLRQQHKQQQALLQQQQQQQEQALQQQLQTLQRSEHKLPQKQSSERMLLQQQQQQQVLQVQPSNGSFTGMQSLQHLQVQPSSGSFTSMQVQPSNGSFPSMQSLQHLQVQPSSGSFTSMQPMQQQQQQQQQGTLQVQHSDSSFTHKSPEQLQREILQLQLQSLQLQQQQQQQQPGVSVGLMQSAMSAPQPLLPSNGLMLSVAGPAAACSQLQPTHNGKLPAGSSSSSSSALSAFAGAAAGGGHGSLSMLQEEIVPGMGVCNGGGFVDLGFDQRLAAGPGASAGLACWGSGQQLNLAPAGSGFGGLFACQSGLAGVSNNVISGGEGAWSFDAGLSFNQ